MAKLIIPSILTVSDVINLADNVLKITLPCTELDTKFNNLYARNKQIFDRLVKNQKSMLKSEFTEDLSQCDKNRDLAFVCLRDIVGGISLSLIDEMSEKAGKLYSTFERFGKNAYRLGYKAESALLLSLFTEFDQPKNQQLFLELGILPYYTSLKQAQLAFDSVSAQKSEEQTLLNNNSEPATLVVDEMIPAMTGLVALLQLYADLEPAIYSDIFNRVITSISETNTVARSRKTRKQNQSEEEKAVQI